MQRKIDRKGKYDENDPGAVGFTSGFSQENSKRWENNYCWVIDRISNNHDDIQAVIII